MLNIKDKIKFTFMQKLSQYNAETKYYEKKRMSLMEGRPKLEKGLDSEVFREYYYLKDELVEFCRKEGL